MIKIPKDNVNFSFNEYTKYLEFNYFNSLTSNSTLSIFPYNSSEYRFLRYFYGESSVSSFGYNIGVYVPGMLTTSGASATTWSTSSVVVQTISATNRFVSYMNVLLRKGYEYNFEFNAYTSGTVTEGINTTFGIQQYVGGDTYGQFSSSSNSLFVTSAGVNYNGSYFSPSADSYYRIVLNGSSAVGRSITYSNVKINIRNSVDYLINANGYNPLQLPVIKISRDISDDKLKWFSLTGFGNTQFKSSNITDTSIKIPNYLFYDNLGNIAGHYFPDYRLIVFDSYRIIPNKPLISNSYVDFKFGNVSVSNSETASISAMSFSSSNLNYSSFIKIPVGIELNNFTQNPSNIQSNGNKYKNFSYLTGFRIYDENLNTLLIGKFSKPIKKSENLKLIITPKVEN